jgi:ABC-type uncharacterized transport system substrate-binding protein
MTPPYRVRVLSSYIYDGEDVPQQGMGRENRWFHGFVRSLTRSGSGVHHFDLKFVRLPQPQDAITGIVSDFMEHGVRLVICAGTDAVLRWSEVCQAIPTLYFGAHPENHGIEITTTGHVSGVRLNLPLIWSWESFSLIRELLPDVRDVFIPLNLSSRFAFPGVRANYEWFRRAHGPTWITAPSTHLGYRSVGFLAGRLGCRYHEGPFANLDELSGMLREIPAGTGSALVGFNDLLLLNGALDLVLGIVRERGLPLFWVNNVPIVRTAGVADFSSDFERVGERLGEMSLRLLRDESPITDIPFAADPGERLTLNRRRCDELGIAVRDAVAGRFHRILTKTADVLPRPGASAGVPAR